MTRRFLVFLVCVLFTVESLFAGTATQKAPQPAKVTTATTGKSTHQKKKKPVKKPVKKETVKKETPKNKKALKKQNTKKNTVQKGSTPAQSQKPIHQKQPAQKSVSPKQPMPQEPLHMLIGKVYNTDKTLEIFNADIYINVFPYPAHTSKDGTFKYPMKLKKGKYIISVQKKGFKPYKGELVVTGDKERFPIELYLAEEKSSENSIMITPTSTKIPAKQKPAVVVKKEEKAPRQPKTKQKPPEKPKLSQESPEEITKKMLATLAEYGQTGVTTLLSPVARLSNGTVVAGSAGRDASFFVNGIKIPFAFGAFSPATIIPAELLESSETVTAGYTGDLQDAAGATVSMKIKRHLDGPMQGAGYFGMDKLKVSLHGQISPKDYFALSFRRNMDDLFGSWFYKGDVNFMTAENYDGMLYYSHKFKKMGKMELGLIGARSDIMFHGNDTSSGMFRTRRTLDSANSFITVFGSWEYKKGGFYNKLGGHLLFSDYHYNNWTGYPFRLDDTSGYVSDEASFSFKKYHTVFAKFMIGGGLFDVDSDRSLLPINGESGMQFSDKIKFDNLDYQKYGRITLSAGYRFSAKGFTVEPTALLLTDFHNKDYTDVWIDPRLTLSYLIKNRVNLYAGGGLYSSMPQFDLNAHEWGTERLTMEHAIHGLLGVRYTGPSFTARLEGFVRSYFNIITRANGTINRYNNEGKALAAGGLGEITYRYKKKLITKFDITVSYAGRKDEENGDWRADDGYIPIMLGFSSKYTPIKALTLGASYHLSSGRPYTEITGTTYYPSFELRLPVYNDTINGERSGYAHLLQADATYTFFLKKQFTVSLSAMIKTGFGTEIDRAYSLYFNRSISLSTIPVVTTLGIAGTF